MSASYKDFFFILETHQSHWKESISIMITHLFLFQAGYATIDTHILLQLCPGFHQDKCWEQEMEKKRVLPTIRHTNYSKSINDSDGAEVALYWQDWAKTWRDYRAAKSHFRQKETPENTINGKSI